jgi:iron(III) transport system substrate-binding protein
MIAASVLARGTPILLMTLALAAGTGCGGSDDGAGGRAALEDLIAEVEGLDGEQRERRLAKLAQEEGGKLSWYTSLTNDTEAAVAEAFEDEYDIEVSVYRSTSETVAQRISEEAEAGFEGTDVVETNGSELALLDREGVFVPYRPSGFGRLAPGSDDNWTATRFNKFVVAWNTDKVPDGTAPASVEELADPRWKGKIALEEGDADWYFTLRSHWIAQGRSEEEADELLEGIASNARVISSHALMTELLGAGEFAVAASNYLHQTRDLIDDGAPVAYMPLAEPVVSRPQGAALVETASHPAAALLFLEWITGAGQELLAENNVIPARKDLVVGAGAEEALVDLDKYVERADELDKQYEDLLRLGERVEGGD